MVDFVDRTVFHSSTGGQRPEGSEKRQRSLSSERQGAPISPYGRPYRLFPSSIQKFYSSDPQSIFAGRCGLSDRPPKARARESKCLKIITQAALFQVFIDKKTSSIYIYSYPPRSKYGGKYPNKKEVSEPYPKSNYPERNDGKTWNPLKRWPSWLRKRLGFF